MDKPRFALALALSFGVLLAWQYFFAPRLDTQKTTVPQPINNSIQSVSNQSLQLFEQPSSVPERNITVETKLWKAVLSNKGGVITKWVLKQLPNGKRMTGSDYSELNLVSSYALKHNSTDKEVELGSSFELKTKSDPGFDKIINSSIYTINTADTLVNLNDDEKKEIAFTYIDQSSGTTIQKKFIFSGESRNGNGFTFDYAVDAKHNSNPIALYTVLGPNFGDQSVKELDSYTHTPPQAIVSNGSLHYVDAPSVKLDTPQKFENIAWAALSDHYFAMAIVPTSKLSETTLSNQKISNIVNGKPNEREYLSVKVGLNNSEKNTVYIGPKDRTYLIPVNEALKNRVDLEVLVNYGFFSFLVRPLIPILDVSVKMLYRYTHNYGWAILLITILVNTLLFPLKWKSSIAMKRTAKMQPKMKELQERMKKLKKDDPRLQETQLEIARLMKDGNPLMGCLPMLLQLPIFWAFFLYLQVSVDIRQSPFIGWISDLSSPDRIHILPIIMCITQIGTTLLMPMPQSDDPAQKFQKTLMTWFLPIILTYFFFWSAPSGLVLYWMAGNLIGITQQLVINKLNPPDVPILQKGSEDKKKLKATSELVVSES